VWLERLPARLENPSPIACATGHNPCLMGFAKLSVAGRAPLVIKCVEPTPTRK